MMFLGKGEKLGAAFGEKGLVSGHHGFSSAESGGDEIEGSVCAADQFDDDIH